MHTWELDFHVVPRDRVVLSVDYLSHGEFAVVRNIAFEGVRVEAHPLVGAQA
jgi:hypothetical protein